MSTKKQTTNNSTKTQSEKRKLKTFSEYSLFDLDRTFGIYKVNCILAKTRSPFGPSKGFIFTLTWELIKDSPVVIAAFNSYHVHNSLDKDLSRSRIFDHRDYDSVLYTDPNCLRRRTSNGSEICEIEGYVRVIHFVNSVDNSDEFKLELMFLTYLGETIKSRYLTSEEITLLRYIHPCFNFTKAVNIEKQL